jgi:Ca-activated chloride channel family protein
MTSWRSPRFTRHASRFTLLASAALCLAWMNPTRDRIAEGNRLFKQGKYEDAIGKYGAVLVDDPDSPLLNFNMGTANYKAGKYTEAINSFARVRPSEAEPQRLAKTLYNAGNAQYRLGAAAEADKPQEALTAYAAALVAYRRALGADPTDPDIKFNYEFVAKKIEDLKKKLEEQQNQDEQQQEPQAGDDQQQQQPEQEQQQGQQEQGEDQQQEQQQAAQQHGDEPPQDEGEEQRAAQAAGASGEKTENMTPQEAAALIDTAKNDELQPEEFARQAQGGAVAEPAHDW